MEKNINYFKLSSNNSKCWTYAPTIYSKSKNIIFDCRKCGAVGKHPSKEFDVDLEGGTKFPDILLCGSWPLLIVSDKVLNDWKSANITGFEYYSIGINKINSNKLRDKEPPNYFHIVVTGRCELDLDKMGIKIKKKCSRCGNVFFDKEPWEMSKLIIKESTWDKSDIFISKLFPALYLCTEKVIITACQNKHTNFRFIESNDALTIMPTPTPIDYLKYCK